MIRLLLQTATAVAALARAFAGDAAAAQSGAEGRDIVVTARRIDATQTALDACVARRCPPDEEVAAALAHAENQFLDGDYRAARRTLHATIGRVDRHARSYPVPVASIWRAESRIAAHLGESAAMRDGQFQAIEALKSGLPKVHQRVLIQRLEVADAFAKLGKIDMARAGYRKVVRQGRELGDPIAQGTALLRVALLDAALAGLQSGDPANTRGSATANYMQAKQSIAQLTETTEPALASFRDAGRLIDARLDARRGDMSGIDRLAAHYYQHRPRRAMLLFAPDINDRNTIFDAKRHADLSERDLDGQWADVTFLIASDGRVKAVEALRESPKMRGTWLDPILTAIGKRRYAPIDVPPGLDGVRRVERYTMTAFKNSPSGHPPERGAPRIEMLDLTADTPAAAPSAGPTP